ncbi:MAG: LCP family protein [Defluviitaleaceae bacterium]|nr:LCP family protein [Defluviitaleaceae bacterium]
MIIAKAFFISSCIFALVVMGGAFIIRNYTIIPPPVPPAISSTATPASIVVEPHADDLGIGHGLRAPLGFTDEDRKELFYTFLIMGLDDGINVDTIMVASYDGIENVASIVSIPRDTLVNVSRRHRKINVAYPAGRIHGGSAEAGIRQLKRELRSIIGFEPDFYIKIDFDAFVRIIDSVGGVDIDVPIHMRYEDPLQGLRIDIPAGMQRLNGEQTLQFARFRLANPGFRTISDFERVQNQQAVVQAMLSSLITPTSLLRIPEFISIFQENVSTNITASEMLWFASQLPDIHSSRALSTYTLPIARNSGPPNWYEFADIPATLQLVNSTINPFTMPITENDVDIAQQ